MVMLHIQLKRMKHTYMLANVLPLHTSLTPGGSIGHFFFFSVSSHVACRIRERSGSVVECLTRDRRAAGSSLTGVTALCPLARTLILA